MNIKEKTKKEKDETVTDDIRGLPVDRGYAWVIAVGKHAHAKLSLVQAGRPVRKTKITWDGWIVHRNNRVA